MQQVLEPPPLQLTANLSERIRERSRRVFRGTWICGLIFGGLVAIINLLPTLRHAEYVEHAGVGNSFLLDGILEALFMAGIGVGLALLVGRLYVRRAKVLSMTGTVITGKVVGKANSIGMDALPARGVGLLRSLLGMIGPVFGNLLPVYTQPAEFEWRGKRRRMDIYLFKGEQPAVNENGELLLVVDQKSHMYPPSPFALRTREHEDATRLQELVETSKPVRPDMRQVSFARRDAKKTVFWIVAGCLAAFLPMFALFGWLTLIWLGLFGGTALVLYLLRDRLDRA